MPGLEVRRFGGANTEQDAQNLEVGYSLRESRIYAGSALLDETEMKPSGISDCLDVRRGSQIVVVARNRGKLSGEQLLTLPRAY